MTARWANEEGKGWRHLTSNTGILILISWVTLGMPPLSRFSHVWYFVGDLLCSPLLSMPFLFSDTLTVLTRGSMGSAQPVPSSYDQLWDPVADIQPRRKFVGSVTSQQGEELWVAGKAWLRTLGPYLQQRVITQPETIFSVLIT